jgi:hypothetical protein
MGWNCFHEPLDCDVQGVDLVHFGDGPRTSLAMPPHESALVAGLAQRHAGVLAVLLDVVGIGWTRGVAHTARQLFDPGKM